jgi:GNAT superfamily N-acetyltransferase
MTSQQPSDFIIRKVAASDFGQWAPVWDGYNCFYGRPEFSPEITRTTWRRFLDPEEPVFGLVAESDGAIIGLVHYLFHRSTTMLEPVCYLQDLFTIESARRGGVGARLIDAVYESAKAAGSSRVYWQTHETNLAAISLYDKLAIRSGFIVYKKEIL